MISETKQCQNCKNEFTIEPEDFSFYEKMKVPPPTWCPECRFQRRLIWRNGRLLFRRSDGHIGEEIFSSFPQQAKVNVFEEEYWKSDAWDALEYGRDYDFSRPFFSQFAELLRVVPLPSKSVQQMVNSEYCDQAGFFKNCYLCFNGDRMEDSAYTFGCTDGKHCFDCSLSNQSELCYECVSVNGSYRTVYSQDCEGCVDVWFSKRCTNCTNCFGCVNLRGKSYCFYNEQLTKEEYAKRISELKLSTVNGIKNVLSETDEFVLKFPVKYYHGFRSVESSGDYLRNVKNVKSSYFADDAQDGKYLFNVYLSTKDSYDYGPWGNTSFLMYECLTCGDHCSSNKFCVESWPSCTNLEYCCYSRSSSDCFGCVSLKRKKFCILNKQYTEGDYHELVVRIKKQMNSMPYKDASGREYKYGEFFASDLSPFAYNETELQDVFPSNKDSVTRLGYIWRDPSPKEFSTTIFAKSLPSNIVDVNDSVLKEIVSCVICGRAYRIIPSELEYLRDAKLPLPTTCVNCRTARRSALRNTPRFYHRHCMKEGCPNNFETAYSPDRPEIVYCESCYQQEVA